MIDTIVHVIFSPRETLNMSSGKARLSLKLGQRKLFQVVKSKPPTFMPEAAANQESSSPQPPPPESSTANIHHHPSVPFSGLCNLGNTCYANSILQALRFCPGFVTELGSLQEVIASTTTEQVVQPSHWTPNAGGSPCNSDAVECDAIVKEPVKEQLASYLHRLWLKMRNEEQKGSAGSLIEPSDFISRLKEEQPLFDNYMQQDAQEMLRYLLTILQDTCNSVQSQNSRAKATPTTVTITPSNGQVKATPPSTTPTTETVSPCNHPMVITIEDDDIEDSNETILGKFAGKKRKLQTVNSKKQVKRLKLSKRRQPQLTAYFSSTKQADGVKEAPNHVASPTKQLPVHQTRTSDFIAETFQGSLVYQLQCFECDTYTRQTEPFLDLSVPVANYELPGFPKGASPLKINSQLANGPKMVGPYSLSWALTQFAFKEKLRGENKYWCDSCCHFCEAERSILISELPAVMTVHLNRFTTQTWGVHSNNIMVSKMGGNLAVPLVISFSQWCSNECRNRNKMYNLFAVVFHSGSSCSSGHYTACVRERECFGLIPSEVQDHHISSNWLYFDDEQVERLSQEQVLDMLSPLSCGSYSAYILFYT